MILPKVGVTCNTALITLSTGHTATVDTALVQVGQLLSQCGMVPVLIPLGVSDDILRQYLEFVDGIILTGGPDIGKISTGNLETEPLKGGVNPQKDLLEWRLCGLALSQNTPLLGICRGLQLVNVYLGGTLYNDLSSDYPSAIPHVALVNEPIAEHKIEIASGSKMSAIFDGLEPTVNSFHHQSIKQLASTLEATAWAEDGVIEAVESSVYESLLGVQFHPEMAYGAGRDEASVNVFRWFADAARRHLSMKKGLRCEVSDLE